MKKSRQDPFPWDRFRDEMASVQMTRATKMRALSRMEGEQKMVRRTAYVLSLALVLLVLSIGGTLALSEHNRADKTDDVMLTLSQASTVIPGKNGMEGSIFTLVDAFYDGKRVLIAYRIENNGQVVSPADMESDAMYDADKVEAPLSRTDECVADKLRNCMEKAGAASAVRYEWLSLCPQTEDGLRMARWYDLYQVDSGDMHYLWLELNDEIKDDLNKNKNRMEGPAAQDAAENVWLDRDEITLQLLFALEEEALVLEEDGQETLYSGMGNTYYSIPVTVRCTDEIEKRTVQDGVVEMTENTFFIRGGQDANAALVTFHELTYDGSGIFLEYSVAGDPLTHAISRKDLVGRNLYDVDQWYIKIMDQKESKVYDTLISGRHEAVSGLVWDVQVHEVMDAQGKSLWYYTDLNGSGSTIEDPVSGNPTRWHTRIDLRVMPEAEGEGDRLARQQTLIDKEEITVMIPLQMEEVILTMEDDKVMYAPGELTGSAIALPVTISRSENLAVSLPWVSTDIGNVQVSVWPTVWGHNGMYLRAQPRDEASDALLTVFSSSSAPRAYNMEADIQVRPLAQADDPNGYLAFAQDYLDMDIGVYSVLLRHVMPGTPVAKNGTIMDAYLDVRAVYDDEIGRWTWVYDWKEGADLKAFAGMDFVEIQIPVTEARIYAKYDEKGRIHAGMEILPVSGDSLTVNIALP